MPAAITLPMPMSSNRPMAPVDVSRGVSSQYLAPRPGSAPTAHQIRAGQLLTDEILNTMQNADLKRDLPMFDRSIDQARRMNDQAALARATQQRQDYIEAQTMLQGHRRGMLPSPIAGTQPEFPYEPGYVEPPPLTIEPPAAPKPPLPQFQNVGGQILIRNADGSARPATPQEMARYQASPTTYNVFGAGNQMLQKGTGKVVAAAPVINPGQAAQMAAQQAQQAAAQQQAQHQAAVQQVRQAQQIRGLQQAQQRGLPTAGVGMNALRLNQLTTARR